VLPSSVAREAPFSGVPVFVFLNNNKQHLKEDRQKLLVDAGADAESSIFIVLLSNCSPRYSPISDKAANSFAKLLALALGFPKVWIVPPNMADMFESDGSRDNFKSKLDNG
jgi:hypothetical protein